MASLHQTQPSLSLPHLDSPAGGSGFFDTIDAGRNESTSAVPATVAGDETASRVEEILHSDIGITSLLERLKQSVASCRDFASFLRKRAVLEEDQAQGLRKLSRSVYDATKRSESRHESYGHQFEEMARIHDRLSDNGLQFAHSLSQMHDDLAELASNIDRGRKHWKQVGLSAEKKVHDAEILMEKAKIKYDNLAEEYDRVKTGDRRAGKSFSLKGPKSGAQYEDELSRRVAAADSDYSSKVKSAQSQRQELINSLRPQAVKALREMINECDAGLTIQLQRFAQLSEQLLLNNGLSVSPMPTGDSAKAPSLREVVAMVDNESDFKTFILGLSSKVPHNPKDHDIQYQRHPSLTPHQQVPSQSPPPPQPPIHSPPPLSSTIISPAASAIEPMQQRQRSETYGSISDPPVSPLQDKQFPYETQGFGAVVQQPITLPPPAHREVSSPQFQRHNSQGSSFPDLPRLRPVFGVPLETLLARDDSAVPIIVYQCIQAVDLYGLDVEGIYRLSGEKKHVERIKAIFDNDASNIDFRRPEDFFHDVNSAASVLKQFFRDLPDPLLTNELYAEFISAARIEDDIARRDNLHGLINQLPDPNYATLRTLILHLNRVQEHSNMNRMNSGNLAICFGPTLMGSNNNPKISDAGWQVRVIDTILQNCFSIFHDD